MGLILLRITMYKATSDMWQEKKDDSRRMMKEGSGRLLYETFKPEIISNASSGAVT